MTSDEHFPEEELNASEDIDFEPDDELGDVGALKAKLKKLREENAALRKEKAEYLDGWQRAKADLINAKKETQDMIQRAQERAKEAFVEDVLPAIDSFDMAMMGEGWQKVESAWRSGVESIRSQIGSALQAHGIEAFGEAGETYDPMLHDIAQDIEGGAAHTIARVLRKGFRIKDRVIRPASVVVYK